jgi:UDP-glucose 4-epimerase
MLSRRVLITGLSSWWGGRIAQALEQEPHVEALIGVDTADPIHELSRTEFVRTQTETGPLRRIIAAAGIDTVIDTRQIADPLLASASRAREVNLAGTSAVLEACRGEASPVRKLIFKSSASYYGSSADDPAFFSEEMPGSGKPNGAIERSVVESEDTVARFAAAHGAPVITVLRLAATLVGEPGSSHLALLGLPVVPSVLGFDPRLQFVHEDDAVAAFVHCARGEMPGAYNVVADGVLALSEVVSQLGKPWLPVLPPWGLGVASLPLRRLGVHLPVDLVRQLRYGRGLENRRLKLTGFDYRYTSRETVLKLRAHQRLRPLLLDRPAAYRYEPEVEEFLRWSPSVQDGRRRPDGDVSDRRSSPASAVGYDELAEGELISIIPSLDLAALERLHTYEAEHQARETVLAALERARSRAGGAEPTGQEREL